MEEMKKNNNLMAGKGEGGKWITVKGSHIFIEDGQSVDEAMEKHFSKSGDTSKSKSPEMSKTVSAADEKQYYKNTKYEDNEEIDWDRVKQNEKVNAENAKNPKRHDKYGNELLSDEAFNVGLEAGKSYLNHMTQFHDLNQLKRSNVFLGNLQTIVSNSIVNNGFNPNLDTTYQDFNEIIGNLLGEEVDLQQYEGRQGSGFTGRKYIGYKPANN